MDIWNKMIFDHLTPPQGPRGGAKNNAVARPIHVSNSYTKFGWISPNCLGGDSITDGQTDTLTVGYFLGTYSVRKSSQESVSA